jgi:hypothetical protein
MYVFFQTSVVLVISWYHWPISAKGKSRKISNIIVSTKYVLKYKICTCYVTFLDYIQHGNVALENWKKKFFISIFGSGLQTGILLPSGVPLNQWLLSYTKLTYLFILYLLLTAIWLAPGGSSTVHICLTPGASSTVHIGLTPGGSSTAHIGLTPGGSSIHLHTNSTQNTGTEHT